MIEARQDAQISANNLCAARSKITALESSMVSTGQGHTQALQKKDNTIRNINATINANKTKPNVNNAEYEDLCLRVRQSSQECDEAKDEHVS